MERDESPSRSPSKKLRRRIMEEQDLPIEHGQVTQAAEALKSSIEKSSEGACESEAKDLFEEPSNIPIFLLISLKKIPHLPHIRMIKVYLPHSLMTDTSEICLITGDLDKRDRKADIEPTIQHYKELLASHDISCVTGIIPLRQLRTEYRAHEARRRLYGAYDMYLADVKIGAYLPKALGKFFYKKRKFPQQVNLKTPFLKQNIERATSRTVLFLTGRGSACAVQVAHFGLSVEQIVENIEAAVKILRYRIPGKWRNVHSLYLRTNTSVAIPLYISLESADNVNLPVMKKDDDVEAEEITTLRRSKVKVYPDGNVEVVPNLEQNSSEDESDFEERLLKREEVLKARQIRKKNNLQICKTKQILEKKTSLNSETKASSNECPEGTKESFKEESGIDVRLKKLKKKTMKKKKNSVDFNVKEEPVEEFKEPVEESKEPAKKKKKIAVDFNMEELKVPAKKKNKIAVNFNMEELKVPAKRKNKIAVNFNMEELKVPAKKKKKMGANVKNKRLNDQPC